MKQKQYIKQLRRVKKVWEQHPWIFIFFYSFIVMLFCTRSSPLYVFNGWVDPNAYFTVGKGLVNGLVPYRDLFDHKGPLTYLLFGLGYLADHDGFWGIYVIQSLMMGITLCFTYKTLLLFSGRKAGCLMLTPLLGLFILWQGCYVGGGASPDEFAIPFEMVSLYYFIRYFCSGEKTHSPWVMFLHGTMAGCVLLLKFNLALFWFGFGAMVFLKLIIEKQYANFWKNLLFLLMGVAAICLPYIFYALVTGSLDDFIEAYFRYNMLYANVEIGFWKKITAMLKNIVRNNITVNMGTFVMSTGGILYFMFRRKSPEGLYWEAGAVVSYILSLISIYFSQEVYLYAFLPNTVFAIFGLAAVSDMLKCAYKKTKLKKRIPIGKTLFAGLLVLAVTVSANGYISNSRLVSSGRGLAPQRQFSQIMHERRENPTMLMYDALDHGFYTAANILPVNRFFYKPSGVPYEKYPAVLDDQNRVLQNKEVDFVVCQTDNPENTDIDNRFLNENYTLVAVSERNLQFSMWYLLFEAKS